MQSSPPPPPLERSRCRCRTQNKARHGLRDVSEQEAEEVMCEEIMNEYNHTYRLTNLLFYVSVRLLKSQSI